jgi:hypothetical protein
MRGLLRLPLRVKRTRDVFNPSVLSGAGSPGRRILSNAIPANGLSASTSDRSAHAECNAPPRRVPVARHPLLRRLSWRLWQLPNRLSIFIPTKATLFMRTEH